MTPTSSTITPTLVERLAQTFGTAVNAQTVYGTPVERDGVTVIPVARAYYGFGGGSGNNAKAGTGEGGGGGATISPVGFIEVKDGSTRFRPIRSSVVPLVAVSGLVALLLLRAVPKLLKGNQQPSAEKWGRPSK